MYAWIIKKTELATFIFDVATRLMKNNSNNETTFCLLERQTCLKKRLESSIQVKGGALIAIKWLDNSAKKCFELTLYKVRWRSGSKNFNFFFKLPAIIYLHNLNFWTSKKKYFWGSFMIFLLFLKKFEF